MFRIRHCYNLIQIENRAATFYVCHKVTQGLFGKSDIISLNLLQINSSKTTPDFTRYYPKCFNCLIKINVQAVHIKLKEKTAPNHLLSPRHTFLLQPLKEELDRILCLGVIRKANKPTEWCHASPFSLPRKRM